MPPPIKGRRLVAAMAAVDLVVFDFDGVFTDNRVLVAEDGSEAVFCNRSDGLGVVNLRRSGVACLVLSLETNPVVARRCEKLGLPFVQGCADKWGALKAILDERKMDPSRVAYVGNDVNDLLCLENVGLAICVADAYPEVKAVARYVTKKRGGEGAVREVCDLVITARRVRARRRSA